MKYFLFLIISLSIQNINAQNWSLINNERSVFFQHSDSSFISNTIVVDSIKVIGNNTSYFTGYGFKYCDTCADFSEQQPIIYRYSKECLGFNIVDDVDNNHQTLDNKIVKHNAEINDTWLYSIGITAEVVEKSETTILGVIDSIKTIELNGLDTIIISKNFGVIRYPDFENGGKYFQMVGYHERQNSYGEYLPNFWRTYDFNVGDVFCYDTRTYASEYEKKDKGRIKILAILSNQDTIKYKVQYLSVENSSYETMDSTIYGSYSRNLIDTLFVINSGGYENNFGIQNKYNVNTILTYPYPVMQRYITFNNVENEFVSSVHYIDELFGNSKEIHHYVPYEDSLLIEITYISQKHFSNFFGATLMFPEPILNDVYESQLVGAIINGDTTGTIYSYPDDLGFEERSHQVLNFYPNPTSETININQPLKNLKVYNNLGQMVLNINEPNQIINISQLPKGLYFIVATDLNSEFLKSKLIID